MEALNSFCVPMVVLFYEVAWLFNPFCATSEFLKWTCLTSNMEWSMAILGDVRVKM